MQLSVNKRRSDARRGSTLVDLERGEAGTLERLDLPEADARRLMELGFLPGSRVRAGHSAPGGDPRVFEVDGSEVALRRETAILLKLRRELPPPKDERMYGVRFRLCRGRAHGGPGRAAKFRKIHPV